jgi:hypothetical protein
MKNKDLKKFINELPDDFDVKVMVVEKVPEHYIDTIKAPYYHENFDVEIGESGYSDNTIKLIINLNKKI